MDRWPGGICFIEHTLNSQTVTAPRSHECHFFRIRSRFSSYRFRFLAGN